SRDPAEEEAGPNRYGFVSNDAIARADRLGLIIVAFYGADVWGGDEGHGANPEIREIVERLEHDGFKVAGDAPYHSLDIWDPYQYLMNYFSSGSGDCHALEHIDIFGHSWGAISAVKLSRWLARSR